MSYGLESTDFEWLDPLVQVPSENVFTGESSSQFLKEGYLHVMEKLPKSVESASSQLGRAMSMVRKLSDPAIQVGHPAPLACPVTCCGPTQGYVCCVAGELEQTLVCALSHAQSLGRRSRQHVQ